MVLGLTFAIGCPASTSTPSVEQAKRLPATVELPPLSVAVAGCDALQTTPACWRGPGHESRGPVVLWLEGDWQADGLGLAFDGRPLAAERYRLEVDVDGIWVEIVDRELRGRLLLELSGHRPFELEIGELSSTYKTARADMFARLKNGDIDQAKDTVERAAQQLVSLEAQLLDCWLTRSVDLVDPNGVSAVLERLQARADEVGELGCASQATLQVALAGLDANTSMAVTARIEQARQAQALDLAARITAEFVEGALLARLGLLGDALEAHARVIRWAAHAGLTRLHASALVESAVILARLGRFTEAEQLARAAEQELRDDPFVREIQFERAWIDILRRRHDPAVADPSALLRELIEFHGQRGELEVEAETRLNLVVAMEQTGEVEQANRELAQIDRKLLDDRQQLYYELMRFRIAFARGQLGLAREHLEHAKLLAEVSQDSEFVLELLDARADLELRAGRPEQARAAYEEAELQADKLARRIPANVGRSSFATTLTPSRARYIELLLATLDVEAALCTILGARARSSRALAAGLDRLSSDPERRREYIERLDSYNRGRQALEERHALEWTLSTQELEQLAIAEQRDHRMLDEQLAQALALLEHDPPEWQCSVPRSDDPTQALLTTYPTADGQGWWFLLDRAGEVRHHRVLGSGTVAAAEALERLSADGGLDEVEQLTIVALGEQLVVDFHALDSLRRPGAPQVRYGLGLGRSLGGASIRAGAAVVVASGGEGLSHVDAEAEHVAARLLAAGWQLDRRWDPSARAQPQLLHYAGHAIYEGPAGWSSYLSLPDGRRLTSPELLVGKRAPSLVVLGACRAGTSDAATIDGGMNIAFAFLLAGAQAVLAADEGVDDRVARELAEALHAALPNRAAVDERSLGEVLARIQRDDPRFDAWRLWVP